MRAPGGGDFLRGSGGDDFASAVAAFGPHVDNPVGRLDDVQIVLDDQQRAAAIDELAEGVEELAHVVEVQTGGGLVQDIKRATSAPALPFAGANVGEVSSKLDALGFAAGERGGGLAEPDVAQADLIEDCQLVEDTGVPGEEAQRLFDRSC